MRADSAIYKELLDNLYDGVYFVDRDRKILYWNKGAERITGYNRSEVVGRNCADNILRHVNDQGVNLCGESCPIVKSIADGCTHEAEIYLYHKNKCQIPILVRVVPIRDGDGQIVGAVEIFSDNSTKVALTNRVNELEKLSLFDPLTEVGNRRYADINLRARLDEMHRYDWPFGILFIDIDHFKKINDLYGHDTGDKVLKTIAKTLVNSLRLFDIACRWGGEEFIAIMVNVNEKQLYSIAKRLSGIIEQLNLSIGQDVIRVTISIGATRAQQNDTVYTLVDRGDRLMYQSKTRGQGCVSIG